MLCQCTHPRVASSRSSTVFQGPGRSSAELAANRRRLEDESDKLLAAHFADAIDLPTLKRHQDRIRAGLADIDRRIQNEHNQDQGPRCQINKALHLLIDCQRLYKTTDPHGKRLANQTFTTGIDINEDEEATLRLAEPFAITTGENTHAKGSTTSEIVEVLGNYSNPDQRRIGVISRLRAATPVETPAGNPTRQTVRPRASRMQKLRPDQIVSPAKICNWARANGYQVGDRGRAPVPIKKAWAVANEL